MEKYKHKKPIKSVGFITRIFNLFSDLFYGEKIEKSFKSVLMSFQGKSKKQIEEHFKIKEYVEEMKMKEKAKQKLEL